MLEDNSDSDSDKFLRLYSIQVLIVLRPAVTRPRHDCGFSAGKSSHPPSSLNCSIAHVIAAAAPVAMAMCPALASATDLASVAATTTPTFAPVSTASFLGPARQQSNTTSVGYR